MQTWTQVYDPLGNLWLSSLVAALPIIFFFLALTVFKMKGHVAGTVTVVIALLVAVLFYHMPVTTALAAVGDGFCFGLWPIAWIIIAAVFLYKLTVKTGQFEIIRSSIVSVTEDQRLQMLLIGFSFGAFLEGAAGFGAPVAITSALLVGMGFEPIYAAGLCLIANTAPVAFGAMGIPILVGAQVAGVDAFRMGAEAGRVLAVLTLLVPFWVIFIMDGWKGVKETWPAVLVAAVTFDVGQLLASNYIGFELPAILGSIFSLIGTAIFLKFWKPKNIFRFKHSKAAGENKTYTGGQIFMAWSPYIILTLSVVLWNLPFFKVLFAKGGALYETTITFAVPYLDKMVLKAPPIAKVLTAYPASFSLNLVSATGTAILVAAVVSMMVVRAKVSMGVSTFFEVLNDLKKPIWTIGSVVAFAYVCNYSGLSSTLALMFAESGSAFTFFSPVLGWVGVFLTGSDTSANALFCALQGATAQQIGVSDILLVAANTTGGTIGKMISPQSIAVACAAVGMVGRESELFKFTLKSSLFFVIIVGILTTIQGYLLPGTIP
ncbi:lactate permease LctP family transporter [Telmatospirillum siberiense]|uniref:L-lactate permease n=1 Tax=Telmatospirillum siberiense TaxID=382514 RepID=A0A2N3PPX3_9PROT|nr:lactate permease LctP family transporter [Telmatospirillum siberiense]PKU22442.1 L-lactate permease [Telmatospirillum siberiense]